MQTKEFIHSLGGIVVISKALGIEVRVVSNWHKRGIPWRWRPAMAELAATKGVEVPADFLISSRAA